MVSLQNADDPYVRAIGGVLILLAVLSIANVEPGPVELPMSFFQSLVVLAIGLIMLGRRRMGNRILEIAESVTGRGDDDDDRETTAGSGSSASGAGSASGSESESTSPSASGDG